MSRRARWHYMVEAAKDEVLNAVEFYNRPTGHRSLEAYLVHMHIAWTYLLHAEFLKDGVSYFYRDQKDPRRYQKVDGEKRTWDLERCIKERWPDEFDPVRKNVDLTIRLRNRIEHRYVPGLTVAAAGFTQALIINFDEEAVAQFGTDYSVADHVHLPVSLSTFSREGVARLVTAQEQLPKRLKDFFIQCRAALPEEVASDRRFEFRIEIIPKRAPKSEADLAVSFANETELSDEELAAYQALERTGRVILREKFRPVSNLNRLKPKAACAKIEADIPFRFRPSAEHSQAWKHFNVRPSTSAKGAARHKTDERYCIYDEAFDDYVYTQKWIDLLVRKCSTKEGFEEVIGRRPTPK